MSSYRELYCLKPAGMFLVTSPFWCDFLKQEPFYLPPTLLCIIQWQMQLQDRYISLIWMMNRASEGARRKLQTWLKAKMWRLLFTGMILNSGPRCVFLRLFISRFYVMNRCMLIEALYICDVRFMYSSV